MTWAIACLGSGMISPRRPFFKPQTILSSTRADAKVPNKLRPRFRREWFGEGVSRGWRDEVQPPGRSCCQWGAVRGGSEMLWRHRHASRAHNSGSYSLPPVSILPFYPLSFTIFLHSTIWELWGGEAVIAQLWVSVYFVAEMIGSILEPTREGMGYLFPPSRGISNFRSKNFSWCI